MNNKNKRTNQKGFTLIELMIVIAIIGVLSAIAVPQYQSYIAKSEAVSALASITSHRTNVETYVLENGTFPATSAALAVPTSPLGIISYENITSAAGSIQFEFNGTGVSPDVVSSKVNLVRDSNGAWSCTSDVDGSLKPKGCS
ncbi:pilin [Vibrio sp. 10N.261.46.E12]|uniref:pilin n=1 Tax=unclassified Vibrio TaxID=2614977 RepID=UPI0009759292|nr:MULTISPECIES: pilin [unclassified Vibrio]OMO34896.1 prepilin-type N-terminal cleavage/methylation domain-containing protein [Vibrio sp. 10N.261.45.E1]PMJ28257.1 prepilin-type N-terminal cleavage/methylation domain-containing protein [Vibrio sp. 10N.286.45.B6]PML88579.1 prepilin-type N-terminal cleavage/methylation domain-containing protein [Vibrio sp. 10N.261.49.E11]PMM78411.1 prepilin-type N-terminal cleavage/methylation domain-containing protein [Vibrio sp. 10N.261.46.F12]PMM91109.1 prepi